MITPTPLGLLVLALATWRLTYALIYEQAPFNVFDLLRRGAYRIGLGGLFSCIYCLSFWVGGLLYLVTLTSPPTQIIGGIIEMMLALSALAILLQHTHNRLRG